MRGHAEIMRRAMAARASWRERGRALHSRLGQLPADFFPDFPWMAVWWHMWVTANPGPTTHEVMEEFFSSERHHALPIIRIEAALWADLLTGTEQIGPGDAQDVRFLSTVLPVAHFVVADSRMRERLRQLRLADDWGTRVFSLRTIDELFAELEALRV
jgi:hypothetical protein